jgi:4-amino-4-deoxy-L-arabinose transferase-like glycosyltransferase
MARHGIAGRSATLGSRHWVLILLTLLAFGRGVWELGEKSLWWDESLSYHRAEGTPAYVLSGQIVLTDNTADVVTIDNHPPLYFALLWGAVRLFGRSEFSLRFLSLAALVLIVPLLYATGKRLGDDRLGLGAAALGAISPMYLWYAQEARMYALLALFSLLSFYFFDRAFFDPSIPVTARAQRPWLVAYLLASACVILTHYLGALLIAVQLLVLGVAFFRRARGRRIILLSMGIILVVVLPIVVYAFFTLPSTTSRAGFRFVPLFELARDLLNSFSLGLSVDVADTHVLLIDLVFLALLVLGLAWFLRPSASTNEHRAGIFVAGFLALPAVVIYLLSYVQPAYMNSRHLIFITPAFYLLVASGLAVFRGRWLGAGLLAWLVILAGVTYSTYNYFEDPRYNKDQHREWGAYLDAHVRPGDVVVVDPPHISDLYQYYTAAGVPWVGAPLLNQPWQETAAVLAGLLGDYDRVWLAFSHTPPWGDPRRFPEQWLNENAFRVDYRGFESYASNVLVACYLPQWPSVNSMPANAHPVSARYDTSLKLEGYRFVSAPRSGESLHIQLYWGIDEPIPFQASVALRLVDAGGHVWGTGEQCPFNGLYPMWQWQPGLLLQDEHQLDIGAGTPPGLYSVELVLVNRPDGCAGGSGGVISPTAVPAAAYRGDGVLVGEVRVERPDKPATPGEMGIEGRRGTQFDGLELLGSNMLPGVVDPGGYVDVTLYWQAHEAPAPGTGFRLQLRDASGEVQQEMPIQPVGAYAAEQWRAGDSWKGQFRLWLPQDAPPERHEVVLLPTPPLQQTGVAAAVRRWLAAGDAGLVLGSLEVRSTLVDQPATPLPLPDDLDVAIPMTATLGDQVRFLGYDLPQPAVRAGERLELTLYWQALRPMDVSYSVFTHLLGPSSEIIAQDDGVPQDGAYPTTAWQPGEVVADPYSFVIPADTEAGSYPLEVGMYRLETGTRLPVIDAGGQRVPDDRLLLAELTVLPASSPASPEAVGFSRLYPGLVDPNP